MPASGNLFIGAKTGIVTSGWIVKESIWRERYLKTISANYWLKATYFYNSWN